MSRTNPAKTRPKTPKFRPAVSEEARENQLIALAYDAVEERIRNGTASAQEYVHFLRLGSMKERKELELMQKKIELDTAKTEALQSAKRIEELYTNAINAFRSYSPPEESDEYD